MTATPYNNVLVYGEDSGNVWLQAELERFLAWMVEHKCSDVALVPSRGAFVRLHGKWIQVTPLHLFSSSEISDLADAISRSNSTSAKIIGRNFQDFPYEIRVDRTTRYRFRVNGTACRDGWGDGMSLVIRANPSTPVDYREIGIDDALLKAAIPDDGLVLFTGVMGSGKTTSLASIIKYIIEELPWNVQTYEDPIEFDLMSLTGRGFCVQHQIPTHMQDFSLAPKASARKAADAVLVGESRDCETLQRMIEMSELGVTAYSTVHTPSVAQTPSRIINTFSTHQQNMIAVSLVSALRLIVQQRLYPRRGGGRVAVREVLALTHAMRQELIQTPIHQLIPTLERMVVEEGTPLIEAAQVQFNLGTLEQDSIDRIDAEFNQGRAA